MAHQHRLEKEKYRQWVKAGLGLGYLKEGLEPFCDDVAKEQHKHILDNIKQTKNLPTVTCGHCALRTLKPDHVKTGNKQCPLGQANCNCCYTSGKFVCPNNVCGAIYDSIITNHASTPPAPNWKNTQTQQWTGDPWSIAKCFINIPGYDQKASAADTDCTGLLHVIINNKYFHNHIQCNVAGANVFSKVRHYRNEIFHSSTMELKVAKANTYIDDMIAVLKDGKELVNRKDAQDAVKKLEELKKNDFIITTKSERDVVHDAVQSISDTIEEYENKLQEKLENVPTIKGVENKLREELENVPTKEDVENTIREKLEKVPTKEDVENKLREKLENVSTKVDVENKLREKLETIPTAKYVEGLETRVTILELDITTLKKEMKDLKTARSFQRDQYDYIRSKLEVIESCWHGLRISETDSGCSDVHADKHLRSVHKLELENIETISSVYADNKDE